ncbi:endospore germination permease [Paenibacillus filicis]|uniref:Endospore germination permease n=1 Tax=Paenibacillus gyeongsangnamensis TaxID=3388067 RepID=A0ABT4Q653_9BACL|nr:endospore germination permease [Paenibacillus filicis]MCZ8512170.1 endospore germination permease [Paenibacillus filicis]
MKLSGMQIFWIIATIEIVMGIWLTITSTIELSKQDAWISMLVAGVAAAALTLLYARLSSLYPNQTLIEFSRTLMGKWLGGMIVLPYFIVWYTLPAVFLRVFGDFIHLLFLDRTPVWFIMILPLGLSIYLTYSGGITGIGRFAEIAGPILYLAFIVSFILNAPNVKWDQLLPVYSDSGWVNILKGALTPASYLAESFMLLVIVSFMHNPRKAPSRSMLAIGLNTLILFIAAFMVVLVFGPNVSGKLRFPYFMMVRSIDIMNFIQNVDIVVVFIWIFGVFTKLSIYLFITSYEMAQLINIKDWRKIIWFGAPAIYIMACLIPNETILGLYPLLWRSLIIPVCGIGIPLLLWIITVVKKKAVNL